MASLHIQVARCIDDTSYPAVVAVQFEDVENIRHTIIEKVPVLGLSEDLRAHSRYPQPGTIDCEVVERFRDSMGRNRVRISTAKPWGIEAVDGKTEFVVFESQLADS